MMYPILNFEVINSSPRLTFSTEGTENWPAWDRFLMIDGKKAFHIGNICGTCNFFFEKKDQANRTFSDQISAKDLAEELNRGLDSATPEQLNLIASILPSDSYLVSLSYVKPNLILPGGLEDYFSKECVKAYGIDGYYGVPHSPKTPYYRSKDQKIGEKMNLFSFVIPLQQPGTNSEERVNFYMKQMQEGKRPTILTLSVLDVKDALLTGEAHWCLAHYLLDGHHKLQAASNSGLEISVLSFLSRKGSNSSEDEIKKISTLLSE